MYSRNVYTTIGSLFPSPSRLFHFFYRLSLSLAFFLPNSDSVSDRGDQHPQRNLCGHG